MSKVLLRKCLEIVEEDLPKCRNEKNNNNKQTKPKQKKDSIFDLIPEKKRLLIQTKTAKINKIKKVDKPTVKQMQNKLKRVKDQTEENVKRLLALDSELKLDDETKELMIKRARTGHYVIKDKKQTEEEDVFTEEDFLKFEKEYFFK